MATELTDALTELGNLWADTWGEILWDARAALTGKGGSAYVPQALRRRILDRDHCICQICHKPGKADTGPDGRPWHIDHILPYSQGGSTTIENLRLSCATCNQRKAGK